MDKLSNATHFFPAGISNNAGSGRDELVPGGEAISDEETASQAERRSRSEIGTSFFHS
jgi:hypothetical protein